MCPNDAKMTAVRSRTGLGPRHLVETPIARNLATGHQCGTTFGRFMYVCSRRCTSADDRVY